MQACPLINNDQGALELPGVLSVDAEVGLQWEWHLDALRHVDERATRPDGRVQGGELVVFSRHNGAEVLLEDLWVLLHPLVGTHEDDAELLQVFAHGVVDDFGVVLRANARKELALRLRDAESLEGLLDLVGDVVPRLLFSLRWLAVVDDLREVELREVATPHRHRTGLKVLVGAEAILQHPGWLILRLGDLPNRGLGQAGLRLAQVGDVVVKGVLLPFVANRLLSDRHGASSSLLDSAG